MKQEYLLLGEILRPQGIRGEVKIKHYTDDPARFLELETVYLKENEQYQPVKLLKARYLQEDVYLLLEGYADRNAAETLRGRELYVDRAHALSLQEDEVFIADLIGVPVLGHTGREIGTLREVLSTGRVDIYVVDTPEGELSFPALRTVVLELSSERLVVEEEKLQEVALYEDRRS